MDGMEWMISIVLRDNNVFKLCFYNILQLFYNIIAKRMFTTILQKVRKARIHNPFAKRLFYNNFHNVHTDTLFPHSYSFIYNIHT